MAYLAVIQARLGSSRLPGKVLMNLAGSPVLSHVVRRVRRSRRVDHVVVATTRGATDDAIVETCREDGVPCFRGDESDVLARFIGAMEEFPTRAVVRITADCPAIDPSVIDKAIEVYEKSGADYVSNTRERSYPHGLDVEVVSAQALREAHLYSTQPQEREHVTPYVWANRQRYQCVQFFADDDERLPELRITLDTEQDFVLLSCIFDLLGTDFGCRELVSFVRQHPWIKEINARIKQKPVFVHPERRVRYAMELHHAARFCAEQGLGVAAAQLVEAGLHMLTTGRDDDTIDVTRKLAIEELEARLSEVVRQST